MKYLDNVVDFDSWEAVSPESTLAILSKDNRELKNQNDIFMNLILLGIILFLIFLYCDHCKKLEQIKENQFILKRQTFFLL